MSNENKNSETKNGNNRSMFHNITLVVLSTILSATVIFLSMTAQCVYALRAEVSEIRSITDNSKEEIKYMRQFGTPPIQGVNARLEALTIGQARIERTLEELVKTHTKP